MSPAPARRRRDDELLDAIRAAVLAELADRGYAGVTYEGVARRAATSKPVLYRRFASRAELVADSLSTLDPATRPFTPGTSLADDLVALTGAMTSRIGTNMFRTFLAIASELSPERLAEVAGQLFGTVGRWITEILDEARVRGEIGPDPLPERVVPALLALVRGEVFLAEATATPDDLRGIVEDVVVPLLRTTSGWTAPPRTFR